MIYLGTKYDQGATCLPRNAAADRRLQSLALVDPRTARRLLITRAHTNKHIQQMRNSTPNNINSINEDIKVFYTLQGLRERKNRRKRI